VRLNAMANIPKTPTNYAQFLLCSLFVLCLISFVPKALGIVLAYGIWHTMIPRHETLAYRNPMPETVVCHSVNADTLASGIPQSHATGLWYATIPVMTLWLLACHSLKSGMANLGSPFQCHPTTAYRKAAPG
jgi:hypothetical protein